MKPGSRAISGTAETGFPSEIVPERSGSSFLDVLLEELAPYDGRMAATLRIVAASVITVAVAMSQQIPEAALSGYLVFFASKKDAGTGIAIAAGLIVAATAGIGLGIIFLQLAADDPMVRLAFLAAFTAGGMFFSQASRLGPMAATVGFVFAFVMTATDIVPIPELLSRALAWLWLVVFVPMTALIIVNIFAGPNPARLMRKGVADRLRAASELLRDGPRAADKARAVLREGIGALEGFGRAGRLIGFVSRAETGRLTATAQQAQALLALLLSRRAGRTADRARADALDSLAIDVERGRVLVQKPRPSPNSADTDGVDAAISQVFAAASGSLAAMRENSEEKTGLLLPDAFTNPDYWHFALKSLLAVIVTYMIYTGWNWFDIHTAMITVFYVSLGTAGETLHKATLRIIGCLVGAAMGAGSIIFLMPHMTDIGHLLLLVAVGSFIAGWVANGSERVQYMGWQMALAFYLCVLHGFGPNFDTDVATNRIIGIIIGNLVVSAVFLNLWPVSVSGRLSATFSKALSMLRAALTEREVQVAGVVPLMAEAQRLGELARFEPKRISGALGDQQRLEAIAQGLEKAAATLESLRAVQSSPRYLAGAPKRVRTATARYESAVTGFLDAADYAILHPDVSVTKRLECKLSEARSALVHLRRIVLDGGGGWARDARRAVSVYVELQEALSDALYNSVPEKALT